MGKKSEYYEKDIEPGDLIVWQGPDYDTLGLVVSTDYKTTAPYAIVLHFSEDGRSSWTRQHLCSNIVLDAMILS